MKQFRNMLYPYVVWLFIMVLVPMLMILLYAFTTAGNEVTTFRFTLDNFSRFLTDTVFLDVLKRSLLIAVVTTVVCVLLGYPIAYTIAKGPERSGFFWIMLITLPTWINMLVRTYAWIGLLSEGGLIQRILSLVGLGNTELLYTEGAVLLGMVYNFLPFMILQIQTSLSKMDHSLLEASADLGASPAMAFLKVTLPLSLPGVINGITLVFLPAVSSFFIPKLLGGGQYFLIGNMIENQFITVGEWNFGSAISMIMAIIMMLLMMAVRKAETRNQGGKED